MTGREFAALQLLVVGAACAIAAGYGYGGWRGACVVAAVLLLGFGLLLAIGSPAPAPALEPSADEVDRTEEDETGEEDHPTMGGPWSGGGVTPAHPYGRSAVS